MTSPIESAVPSASVAAVRPLRTRSSQLERVALLDTGTDPLPDGARGDEERAKRMALLRLAHERGMRAMGLEWARGMVHPKHVDTPLFELILDMIERKMPEIFAAQIHALLHRPDARGTLASLRMPTLLLCGRQDAWSPLARHEQMHAQLPGSRLVVLEECGHMTTMEQPQAVSAALLAWLEE